MMKLSKREKYMLILLALVILITGYYQFIYTPQMNKIKELKAKIEEYENVNLITKIQASPQNKVYKEFKILNSKIDMITSYFFPDIIQEKIIINLNEMINNSQIKVKSMNFTEPSYGLIETRETEENKESLLEQYVKIYNEISRTINKTEKINKEKSEQNLEKKESLDDKIKRMTVSLKFDGSYEKIMSFLNEVESSNRKIIIKNLNIVQADDEFMTGNIILDYFAIPKITEEDEEYLNWYIENEYGKDNPFEVFEGYERSRYFIEDSQKRSDEKKEKLYDFSMAVMPFSADVPTVIISNRYDKSIDSTIFADNMDIEPVELQILQKSDKYYFKYKTKEERYPQNYDDLGIQFNPLSDEINLRIVSKIRNGADDNSGVALSLINYSDLRLNVDILNDDLKRPRILIKKKKGDININK